MKTAYFLIITIALIFGTSSLTYSTNFALQLDGKDDHVSCGTKNLPLENTPRTLEAWFNTTSPDGYQQVVGYGTAGTINSAFALFTKGKEIVITQWGDSVAIPAGVNDGKWHHGAVTHDGGSKQTIYVDGKVVGNWSKSLNTVVKTCIIGSCLNENEQFFIGAIDEVRIWSVERTEKEIQDNMNKGLTGKEPDLVSYWNLDEGDGETVNDLVGNNDGKLMNNPKWIESDAPVMSASVSSFGKLTTKWGEIKNNS